MYSPAVFLHKDQMMQVNEDTVEIMQAVQQQKLSLIGPDGPDEPGPVPAPLPQEGERQEEDSEQEGEPEPEQETEPEQGAEPEQEQEQETKKGRKNRRNS